MTTFDFEHVHSLIRDPPAPGDMLWYKAHGLLLYAAFAILYPLGVFGVRYGRYHARFRHWFQYHWALQSVGVSLSTGAVSIALRKFQNTRDTTHGYIGFVLAFVILVQPIFALFRPDKGSEWRRWWENSHWFVGTGGIILGWVNIFKGLDLYFVDWPGAGSQLILTTLFTVQIIIVAFLYLLFDRTHRKRPDHPEADSMVPLMATSIAKDSQFLTNV